MTNLTRPVEGDVRARAIRPDRKTCHKCHCPDLPEGSAQRGPTLADAFVEISALRAELARLTALVEAERKASELVVADAELLHAIAFYQQPDSEPFLASQVADAARIDPRLAKAIARVRRGKETAAAATGSALWRLQGREVDGMSVMGLERTREGRWWRIILVTGATGGVVALP